MMRVAWRRFRHGLGSGQHRTLLAALAVTIAALTAVGMFAERMGRLLNTEANNLLAADAVLSADHPIAGQHRGAATAAGLAQAELAVFPSMVSAGGASTLATLKAVAGPYPLRGRLELAEGAAASAGPPPRGEVWVDRRLASMLGLAPGARLKVGLLEMRVAALIEREPDSAVDFSSLQPRLILNMDDLPASGLIGFGSRVRYRLLVAGPPEAVAGWQQRIAPALARGERLEDVRESQPELKAALERAETFLRLVTLLAATLSAVAILLAARRYALQQADAIALYVAIGAPRARVRALLAAELALLLTIGTLAGGALGWLAQQALALAIADQLPAPLPGGSARPWAQASALGALLMLGMSGPVLLQLANTPPLRVLRRELQAPPRLWLGWLATLGTAGLMFYAVAGSAPLAASVAAGMGATLLLAGGLGALLLGLLAARARGFAARIALRQLLRRRWLALAQLAALSVGLLGLWLLTSVQGELLGTWQQRLPADAPNQFAINLQPGQEQAFASVLEAHGLPAPTLQPMIRGRWIALNGQPVDPARYTDDRARRLAEREFNLSSGDTERGDNRRIVGPPLDEDRPGFSVEAGLAADLGIRIGDTLEFDVAGSRISAPVVNLRRVDWQSFRVNFFVTGTRTMFAQLPSSLITSFHLPPERRELVPALVARLPNVTLIDVGQAMAQIRRIIDLASSALKLVFAFCLLAGLVVLLAALETTAPERRRETAVLRALGADSRRIAAIQRWEGASIGGTAGLVAGAGAALTGWLVGRQVLDLPVGFDAWLIPQSLAAGIALALAVTLWERRRLRRVSALELLRDPG